ncbi:hypothetical protein ACFL16_01670 [Patescibacteria group bacterium]
MATEITTDLCDVCNRVGKGKRYNLPSKNSPNYEDARKSVLAIYKVEEPFICADCFHKKTRRQRRRTKN